jgi:hypothetical protein
MLPLQDLAQTFPAHQIAGRFGLEILGLLWPVSDGPPHEGVRLYTNPDPARPLNLTAVFSQSAPSVISRAVLHDHFVVAACRGEFFSTDKIALIQLNAIGEEWLINLEVTHIENVNAIPAPRALYVLFYIDVGDRPLRSLGLQVTAQWQDYPV